MDNCNNIYKNKKVLITGATGFKGTWLSIWLNKLGAEVIGYSLKASTFPSIFDICNMENRITNIIGDIRDYTNLLSTIDKYKPDVVFHLAAQPLVRQSYKEPIDTYSTNVMGTVNVLESIRKSNSIQVVVVVTTDKCYENKEWVYGYRENDHLGGYDPYSSSKGCAELIVSSYRNSFYNEEGIALASARAGNVIGGGDWAEDRLIPDFIRAVSEDRSVVIRNPLATRPWQHVLEPLSGYLKLGALMLQNKKKYSSAWNFGPRDRDVLSVEEILNLSIDCFGKGSIKLDEGDNPHEANLLKLDISKAMSSLKWKPVYDANQAIKKTMNWYKAYYENKERNMYEYTLHQIEQYENESVTKNDLECIL